MDTRHAQAGCRDMRAGKRNTDKISEFKEKKFKMTRSMYLNVRTHMNMRTEQQARDYLI